MGELWMIIKKHWLHGDIKFNVDVKKETDCGSCIHWIVCKVGNPEKRKTCLNYEFGTSADTTCNGCIHRHTRYTRDEVVHGTPNRIPCWICRFYQPFPIKTLREIAKVRDELNSVMDQICEVTDGPTKNKLWSRHKRLEKKLTKLYQDANMGIE